VVRGSGLFGEQQLGLVTLVLFLFGDEDAVVLCQGGR